MDEGKRLESVLIGTLTCVVNRGVGVNKNGGTVGGEQRYRIPSSHSAEVKEVQILY